MRVLFVAFLSLLMFLFSSCERRYSGYEVRGNTSVVIAPFRSSIASGEPVDWNVGPISKQVLSKGIRIKIMFPKLDYSHLKDLVNRMDADAWLVRIHKQSNFGSEVLGYFYIPLVKPGNVRPAMLRVKQMDYGMVQIYYAAASVSPRFENLLCPPFEHQLYIDDEDVVLSEDTGRLSKLVVGRGESATVQAKLDTFGYKPATLNGGKSLVGTYFVDFALYDIQKKMRRSSYLRLPQTVRVKLEKNRPIKGCSGFTPPPRGPQKSRDYKDFKFGR